MKELILSHIKRHGGCAQACAYVSGRFAAGVSPDDLWTELSNLRRTPEEAEAERLARRENPAWKPDPETHTGRSWMAWFCLSLGMSVGTGTYSGRPKVHPGPEVHTLQWPTVQTKLEARVRLLQTDRSLL